MKCDEFRTLIAEACYDELVPEIREKFSLHAASCQNCGLQYKRMESVLRLMDLRERPGFDHSRWEIKWQEIRDKIKERNEEPVSSRGRRFLKVVDAPLWVYGTAAVLLIAVGIYIGRSLWTSKLPVADKHYNISAGAEDPIARQAIAYLVKSKALLIGVMNVSDKDYPGATAEHQQNISRQLVRQAGYLKTALSRPDQQQLKQLIEDLEIILLQLANIEVKPGTPAVELVRSGVERKSILLKINVEEIRAMSRDAADDETENNKL